jgi:hypothetical protein
VLKKPVFERDHLMSSRQKSNKQLWPSIKWPNWTGPYSNIIELTLVGLLLFAIASFIYQLIVWRGWILYNGDAWRLYYPAKAFMFSHLKESQFPIWTPHLFFGFPFFAEARRRAIPHPFIVVDI